MRVFVHPGVDYYAFLGVKRDATIQEIRRAYRKKAWELHPDRQAAELRSQAEHWTKVLNVAFETLRDPRRREVYDARRDAPQWPARPAPTTTARPYTAAAASGFSWTPAWSRDDEPVWTPPRPMLPFMSDPALTAVLFAASTFVLVLRAVL